MDKTPKKGLPTGLDHEKNIRTSQSVELCFLQVSLRPRIHRYAK